MNIGHLPAGSRGFDCNAHVSPAAAHAFKAAGYTFAVRYVRRAPVNPQDITVAEMTGILQAGLALMLVQHVAMPGWRATTDLGRMYGEPAALEAARAGYPHTGHLWCDLEEVAHDVTQQAVIDYCNAWHRAVSLAGYRPGLYVGYGARLSAEQLYRKLHFDSYWMAYNANSDTVPVVRGACMRQRPYPPPARRVAGIPFEYDENIITGDLLGGSPSLLLPWAP